VKKKKVIEKRVGDIFVSVTAGGLRKCRCIHDDKKEENHDLCPECEKLVLDNPGKY